MEKPLATGAVMPSGKPLARAMAKFVDPSLEGRVIELGPGTGAVTAALVEQGVDPVRLVLVEFNPTFCRLLRVRYPEATARQSAAAAGGGGGVGAAFVHQAAQVPPASRQ